MSAVVISSNSSIKYGNKIKKSALIVGSNGDTGRVTWYNAATNGPSIISNELGTYPGGMVKPQNLVPYVTFAVAGGGSNNRESFTQVWVDNILIYSNQQTNGAPTGFTIYFPFNGNFHMAQGSTIEYRLQSNKDVGGVNARTIATGFVDTETGALYPSGLVIQEMVNSP